jgi:CRISPR-associated exonuclease Cas4
MGKRQFDWTVLQPNDANATDAEVKARRASRPERGGQGASPTGYRVPTTDYRLPTTSSPLRVNDLKQFAYCQRIVFYQYVMPVERKATFKMERGKEIESRIERLEQRRTLHRYGLGDGTRRFQVWLSSPRLLLSGRLDLLVVTQQEAVPVDFKDTLSRVHHNHHVQLCAYALLVEDSLGLPVRRGFIYRVPRDDVVVVPITEDLRGETLRALDEIRAMLVSERMPLPTPVRARCDDCEYRNYCGDIF